MASTRPQKKKPSEINRAPLKELAMSAEDWAEFEHGVRLFNACKFWNAHEAWEQVWLRHKEDERLFFQALIQLAAAYHQLLTKASHRGLLNNFDKSYEKLAVFEPEYLGVLVKPLLKFIEEGKKEAERLGPAGVQEFNHNLIPKLQFHKPVNPDLRVEITEVVRSERFRDGVRLFNEGYHWEAHEAFEDVWRDQESDAKTYVQGFVQMAAAYSFIKLHKAGSAVYLFEKALQKFVEFEHLDGGIALKPLIDSMQVGLLAIRRSAGNGETKVKDAPPPMIALPQGS
jgi:predicted metal-dependent hydrolase